MVDGGGRPQKTCKICIRVLTTVFRAKQEMLITRKGCCLSTLIASVALKASRAFLQGALSCQLRSSGKGSWRQLGDTAVFSFHTPSNEHASITNSILARKARQCGQEVLGHMIPWRTIVIGRVSWVKSRDTSASAMRDIETGTETLDSSIRNVLSVHGDFWRTGMCILTIWDFFFCIRGSSK